MENNSSKPDVSGIVKSTILTVITHSLLPLTLFPFALFVVPTFAAKAGEFGVELPKLTLFVFNLSSFISRYWYLCVLILGFGLTIDAVIYFLLFRFTKKTVVYLWSGLVIFIQAVFAGLCVLALLLSLNVLSNIPWLCPV